MRRNNQKKTTRMKDCKPQQFNSPQCEGNSAGVVTKRRRSCCKSPDSIQIHNWTTDCMHQQGGSGGIEKRRRNSVMTRVQPYENVFKVGTGKVEWVMYDKPAVDKKRPCVRKTSHVESTTTTTTKNTHVEKVTTNEATKKGRTSISWSELFN